MGVNRVDFGDETIIDISDSTVTENNLMEGEVAYGADGEKVIGRATGGTGDYEALNNKPQINGETLIGNKSGTELGLQNDIDLSVIDGKLNQTYDPNGDASNETTDSIVLNSTASAMNAKLDDIKKAIESHNAPYVLPIASKSVVGGIKIPINSPFTVDSDGSIKYTPRMNSPANTIAFYAATHLYTLDSENLPSLVNIYISESQFICDLESILSISFADTYIQTRRISTGVMTNFMSEDLLIYDFEVTTYQNQKCLLLKCSQLSSPTSEMELIQATMRYRYLY